MRLIDADALFAEEKERHDMYDGCSYIGDKARRDELGIIMADIVNAPTMMSWVSVKDKLPESAGQTVIVCGVNTFDQHQTFTAFLGYGDFIWYTSYVEYMENYAIEDNRVSTNWEITHWMPLPEPQEEEEAR